MLSTFHHQSLIDGILFGSIQKLEEGNDIHQLAQTQLPALQRDDGQWGTVCDGSSSSDDLNTAIVACRQLGFTKTVGYWYLGRGTGKVWLDGMYCSGSESSLGSCSHSGWGSVGSYCNGHTYDVGVVL